MPINKMGFGSATVSISSFEPQQSNLALGSAGNRLFEDHLQDDKKELSGDQYYLLHLEELQQSALDFSASKTKGDRFNPFEWREARNRPEQVAKIDSPQEERDLTLPMPLPFQTIRSAMLQAASQTSNKLIQGIKQAIHYLELPERTSLLNPGDETTRLKSHEFSPNHKAIIKHQQYQLYLNQDEVELSLNRQTIPDEELPALLKQIKLILNQKGLKLRQLLINGVKQ